MRTSTKNHLYTPWSHCSKHPQNSSKSHKKQHDQLFRNSKDLKQPEQCWERIGYENLPGNFKGSHSCSETRSSKARARNRGTLQRDRRTKRAGRFEEGQRGPGGLERAKTCGRVLQETAKPLNRAMDMSPQLGPALACCPQGVPDQNKDNVP